MQTNPRAEASTGELVKEAASAAGALISREMEVAKGDLRRVVAEASTGAAAFGVAAVAGAAGAQLLLFSFVLSQRKHPGRVLALGLGLLGVAGAAAAVGITALPKEPFKESREHIAADLTQLKEELT